jgi:hypothetical protein
MAQSLALPLFVVPSRGAGACSCACSRRREPVRVGVPLPRGVLRDPAQLRLLDLNGRDCPMDARVSDRWSDGSIRWALLDFQADHDGSDGPLRYELRDSGERHQNSGQTPSLRILEEPQGVSVHTGPAVFSFSHGAGVLPTVSVDAVPVIDAVRSGLRIEWADGTVTPLLTKGARIEESGAVRAVVRIDGEVAHSGGSRLRVVTRVTLHAGSATTQWALTVHNPARAVHGGGFWELGDPGSVLFRDVSVEVACAEAGGGVRVSCSPTTAAPMSSCGDRLELYQASSGGEQWNHATHVDRDGALVLPFRGYVLDSGERREHGLRATPIVSVARGSHVVTVAMRQFWENFPKAIEVGGGGLVLRLFPRQHPGLHEIQGGERKTHAFAIAFGHDEVSDVPLDWVRAPLSVRTSPDHYAASGAVPYLATAAHTDPEYAGLVVAAVEGADSFVAKRERVDEYGWRHFGDVHADHEAAFFTGPQPPVSHYNNQYDGVAGCAHQFMATGDARWHALMHDMATHVADVDVYHTVEDKAAYNGGLFWHTAHYQDAGRSTHRTYPRAPGVTGGGPANEHNYATGLMLHHFLTGDPLTRETAVGLAQWAVDMDDGERTPLRWLARGATGKASSTASEIYHGPGRGAGNSIVSLLVGHQLTGEGRFLAKAEELIRRCIHPADDPDVLDLLNREARWSYTVFACALGRYLDYTAERGTFDQMHGHARESLLMLVRWMEGHEYPYLDRPGELEYPTETWAAQEMWKSEAFAFAAKYSGDAALRERCLERAEFFFDYAVRTLSQMPTRTCTRPVVLLLSRGHMHDQVRLQAPVLEREAGWIAAPRESFEPQKVRALRRARLIAGTLLGVSLAAAAGVAIWFV